MILFMEFVVVAVIVVLASVRSFNLGYNAAIDEIKEANGEEE
jgi:hypothetical protein